MGILMIMMYFFIVLLLVMIIALVVITIRRPSSPPKMNSTPVYPNANAVNIQKEIQENPYLSSRIPGYIILLIFCFLATIFIAKGMNSTYSASYNNIRICGIIMVFLVGIYLVYGLTKSLKIYLLYNKIISSGENVPGKIINYCQKITYLNHRTGSISIKYYLVIKYEDLYTGKEKILVTPELKFNPNNLLGTDKCTVYFYNNMVVASDFKTYLETGNAPIFLIKDNKYLKYFPDLLFIIISILFIVTSFAMFYFIKENTGSLL